MLPRSLTLMGSPIDTRRSATLVNTYATRHSEDWLEHTALSIVPEGYPGARRLVYPGFVQLAAFISMHPERHQKSLSDAIRHYAQGDFVNAQKINSFYSEFCSVMDLTAEFYLQTVRVVFQEALLPQGKWLSRGRKVDPEAIRKTPLFAVEAEHDDICGVGQTKAALDISTNLPEDKKQYYFLDDAGHYGLFNGHRYRENVLPRIREFVKKAEAQPTSSKNTIALARSG
jgi:poly(3-hydroxybutyrate) depolymerase